MTFNNYLLYIELIVDVFTVLFLTYLSYSFLFFTANGRKLQQRNPIDFENPFFRFALLYLITKLQKNFCIPTTFLSLNLILLFDI